MSNPLRTYGTPRKKRHLSKSQWKQNRARRNLSNLLTPRDYLKRDSNRRIERPLKITVGTPQTRQRNRKRRIELAHEITPIKPHDLQLPHPHARAFTNPKRQNRQKITIGLQKNRTHQRGKRRKIQKLARRDCPDNPGERTGILSLPRNR